MSGPAPIPPNVIRPKVGSILQTDMVKYSPEDIHKYCKEWLQGERSIHDLPDKCPICIRKSKDGNIS